MIDSPRLTGNTRLFSSDCDSLSIDEYFLSNYFDTLKCTNLSSTETKVVAKYLRHQSVVEYKMTCSELTAFILLNFSLPKII